MLKGDRRGLKISNFNVLYKGPIFIVYFKIIKKWKSWIQISSNNQVDQYEKSLYIIFKIKKIKRLLVFNQNVFILSSEIILYNQIIIYVVITIIVIIIIIIITSVNIIISIKKKIFFRVFLYGHNPNTAAGSTKENYLSLQWSFLHFRSHF